MARLTDHISGPGYSMRARRQSMRWLTATGRPPDCQVVHLRSFCNPPLTRGLKRVACPAPASFAILVLRQFSPSTVRCQSLAPPARSLGIFRTYSTKPRNSNFLVSRLGSGLLARPRREPMRRPTHDRHNIRQSRGGITPSHHINHQIPREDPGPLHHRQRPRS